MKIKTLSRTCEACPSQWQGKMDNGDGIYIRYRWGWLSWGISKDNPISAATLCTPVQLGDDLDGYMSDEEMLEQLKKLAGIDPPAIIT